MVFFPVYKAGSSAGYLASFLPAGKTFFAL